MKHLKNTKKGWVEFEPKNEMPTFPEFEIKTSKLKSGDTKIEYATKVLKGDYYLEVKLSDKIKVLTGDSLKKSIDRFNHHVQLQRIHVKV